MSRFLHWVKGKTSDRLLHEWFPPDTRGDRKTGYFGQFLEDLDLLELDYGKLSPNLKENIQTLKLQVRYILPYEASGVLTVEESYGKTKRRYLSGYKIMKIKRHFGIGDCHEGLDGFVLDMRRRTLIVERDATRFYHSAFVGKYDWLKCATCVLENMKYARTLETDHTVVIKALEERLTFLLSFRVLMGRWKFEGERNKATLADVYAIFDSLIWEAAYFFQLFVHENGEALEFSGVLQKIYDCQKQVKLVYLEKLDDLGLNPSGTYHVKSETLCGFIVLVQNILKEILDSLKGSIDLEKQSQIQEIVLEMEFIRTILMDPGGECLEEGKLEVMSTHVDTLIHESESVVYSLANEVEKHEATLKMVVGLNEKIKVTRHEFRNINIKEVHCSIYELLKCSGTLLSGAVTKELLFLLTFLRCTGRWGMEHHHPLLGTIRMHVEKVVHNARWELRCFMFRKPSIVGQQLDQELESLSSHLLENLRIKKFDVMQLCGQIKVLSPTTLSSPMSRSLGLEIADTLCTKLRNLQVCDQDSFSVLKIQLKDEITFLGLLRVITAELCTSSDDKTRFDLLSHLEDLTERTVCLSYLQLLEKQTQAQTQINEGVADIFDQVITSAVWEMSDFKNPCDQVMLPALRFLMERSNNSDANDNNFHSETVEKEITIMRCILTDPLLQYSDQQQLDDLLREIGAGICELGMYFYCSRTSNQLRENMILSSVVETVKAAVRQAYVTFAKLSPTKLSQCELGCLEILVANLMELKKGEADCTPTTKKEIAALHDDMDKCRLLLEGNELSSNLKTLVLNVAYKVESLIDIFAMVPDWYFRMRLSDIIQEFNLVKEEIKKTENGLVSKKEGPKSKNKLKVSQSFKDETILGFEDGEEKLMKQLCRGSHKLEVVSIVGMPGLGKTTLAKKVYEAVSRSFHTHAWCYVSQNFQPKELLHDIINQIDGPNSRIYDMNIEDLAQNLYQSLLKKKDYLIVLDDVWDIKAWNSLKRCFPLGNNGGKILLTTRFTNIVSQTGGDDVTCLELKPLPPEKSWDLLERKVFGGRNCPKPFEIVGRRIARKIGGLPFSIVVIAGVLKNIEEEVDKWKQVEESLVSFIENQDNFLSKLELSYNHLPVCLKLCFLYCGMFLRGKEISRSKLVQLWVAERFIDQTHGRQSVEDTAECYLRDLVDRSLLMVTKTGSGNRIQRCRMNDLLRDFCIRKAEEEKFLHMSHRYDSLPTWHRRLCFRRTSLFDVVKDSLPSTADTRSLMFNPYLVDLAPQIIVDFKISFDFDKFNFLKVLDMEGISMGVVFPESITNLVLLTYLAVRGEVDYIPSSIGNLLNLETFIVIGKRGASVSVPSTLFDLQKLRHMRVGDYAEIAATQSSTSLNSLQTLTTASLCSCETCDKAISRVPNLRKLKCIFQEHWDESANCNVFPDLETLTHLDTLSVTCSGPARYPSKFGFPSTLKKLTLSKFGLPWSELEKIVESLPLEILKLKDEAVKGQKWVTRAEYPGLKYLKLERLDIEEWEALEDCFPSLERLVVQSCNSLKAIPFDFSQVETMTCVEVHWCGVSVAKSAEEIEKGQKNSGNKDFKTITSCIGLDLSEEELQCRKGSSKFEGVSLKDLLSVVFDPFGMGPNMGA